MSKLPRPWNCFEVYLFDIDGTLLQCADAVHYFAFCDVLSRVAGRPLTLDGVVAHGNTDVGILRDALVLADVSEERWRPELDAMKRRMCANVQAREKEVCAAALPGVREVLEHLRGRGATLGVATGNLEAIGKLKLQRAGLLTLFDFGGWSDEFEFRTDVFKAAVTKARGIAGDAAAICVVGDTPADIWAAHENGLPVIAVATGIYPLEELVPAGPELCVNSMQELLAAVQCLPA
ncbi:MAG TPA: HAD family hydrolase [Silvibacterium sp.]|nr:HAD family hydrolase [Silvibacterium sp.]